MRLAAADRLMMGRFVATELSLSAGLAGWDRLGCATWTDCRSVCGNQFNLFPYVHPSEGFGCMVGWMDGWVITSDGSKFIY